MGHLNSLGKAIHETSTSKGFAPPDAGNMDQKLLLVVSEVCEAQEVLRDGTPITNIWEEDNGKPEGFPVECADAIIRLLHIMHSVGIDIDAVVEQKMRFNEARPHMHGRVY
jgi:hypothetical protein